MAITKPLWRPALYEIHHPETCPSGSSHTFIIPIQTWKSSGRDTLHQASLDPTTTLVQHYTKVIRAEQETLDKIKQEMTEYLSHNLMGQLEKKRSKNGKNSQKKVKRRLENLATA